VITGTALQARLFDLELSRRVAGEARSGPGPARMTVGLVCAFRLDLTAPPNRSSQGTAIEGLFHPDRRSPSDGQDQVARKGPSATPTDPGTGRFELSGPVDPGCLACVHPGPWILLRPASQDATPARPARPRSVRSPSPAWAGTKSPPPRWGRVYCAPGLRTGAFVTLIIFQGVERVGVLRGADGDRRRSIPPGDMLSRQGLDRSTHEPWGECVSPPSPTAPDDYPKLSGRRWGHALTSSPLRTRSAHCRESMSPARGVTPPSPLRERVRTTP
jgi:hypothetical protein